MHSLAFNICLGAASAAASQEKPVCSAWSGALEALPRRQPRATTASCLGVARQAPSSWFGIHRHSSTPSKRGPLVVRAESGSGGKGGKQDRLPIFPLGMVALPAAQTPLHIFEARYRVLFSTLLAGDDGIEDGLVSEKPWKGTKRFGMAFFDQQQGGLATIGTVLEVQEHSLLEDGRLLVQNVGRERFKILNVVEERPLLVCDVEYLDDADGPVETAEAKVLAEEVAGLFRDVVRLSSKVRDSELDPEVMDPPQLEQLGPSDLSFWVASLFAGNPYNQQALLEEDSTLKRLKVEQELLSNTAKYLGAQVALQSAFSGGSGGGDAPPSGGPD